MDLRKTAIVATETTEQNGKPDECTPRLSKSLSSYEMAGIESDGRARQLRKERDVERIRNEKLRKDIDKLTNQLLCERMKVSSLEKEVKKLTKKNEDETEDISEKGNISQETAVPGASTGIPGAGEHTIDPNLQNSVTLKLAELKAAMEQRVEGQRTFKDTPKDQEAFIRLSILIQNLQKYLEANRENKQPHEPTDVVDSGPTNFGSQLNNCAPKAQISLWLKILVYIGPIFLSALCYLAFNTVKK